MFTAPVLAAFARSADSIAGETSTAITRLQYGATASAKVPVPAPKSITVLSSSRPCDRSTATSSAGSNAAFLS